MAKNKKIKALVMFSGGLDSILAAKLLQQQNIEVTGLNCVSYFFDNQSAIKAAGQLGLKLITIDFSDGHLTTLKKPRYGYGKRMNPCLDCHLLMLKKAKEIMEKNDFDFIATGEVLGERPMSQNKRALNLLEKESGLKGYLLRPLSAKWLDPTVPEKEGWVNRNNLLDLRGRGRKRQIALARGWGIADYPTPSGGCLLTDLEFSKKISELLIFWPDCDGNDVKLLKLGRHFWVGENKIIVGRNEQENDEIKRLAQKGDVLIEPKEFAGPLILIRSKKQISKASLLKAKELMIKYSPKLKASML